MSLFDHHDIHGMGTSCGDAEAEVVRLRAQLAEYKAESVRLGDAANTLVQNLTAASYARQRIADAHSKHVGEGGLTSGDCNECNWHWPCPTYVWATTDRDPNGPWDPSDDDPPSTPRAQARQRVGY